MRILFKDFKKRKILREIKERYEANLTKVWTKPQEVFLIKEMMEKDGFLNEDSFELFTATDDLINCKRDLSPEFQNVLKGEQIIAMRSRDIGEVLSER